jgi:hypothetical protein
LWSTFSAWLKAWNGLLLSGYLSADGRERAADLVLQIEETLVLSGGLDDRTPFLSGDPENFERVPRPRTLKPHIGMSMLSNEALTMVVKHESTI